jgi:ATP-dependent Clp protease ATP-binding subunit ClpA
MFERFTEPARRVVVLAQDGARSLDHNYIGTEHILLGLIDEGEGVAARVLESLGISLESVRSEVERTIGRGTRAPGGHIPFTPRAKKVLELSLREALRLRHSYIGTEHILLGLIREGEGLAAQVLVALGADLERTRRQVIHVLVEQQTGTDPATSEPRPSFEPPPLSVGRRAPSAEEGAHRLTSVLASLVEENQRLRAEVDRLRALLRQHDIEPEGPGRAGDEPGGPDEPPGGPSGPEEPNEPGRTSGPGQTSGPGEPGEPTKTMKSDAPGEPGSVA